MPLPKVVAPTFELQLITGKKDFFSTMPKLQYKGSVHNPKTKKDSEVVIEGLTNFFA